MQKNRTFNVEKKLLQEDEIKPSDFGTNNRFASNKIQFMYRLMDDSRRESEVTRCLEMR